MRSRWGPYCVPVPLVAQTQVMTVHDLSVMSTWPLGKMQVKGAIGQSASFAIAELPVGLRGNPHHHAQEQIVLGLNGSTEITIDGTIHRLGTYGAVIPPSNAAHSNGNGGANAATFIEFQAVLRTDWFPPHQKFAAAPAAPAPVAVPPGRQVFSDFAVSSDGWQVDATGARSKVLSGQTIRLIVWDLSAANATVNVTSKSVPGEHFVYVLEGQAEMAAGSGRREIKSETLVVVSAAAEGVTLRSLNKGRSLVAVFESTLALK